MKYFSRSDRFYFDNVSGVPFSSHSLMVMTNFSVTGHKNIGFVPNRNNLGTEGKFLGFVMLTRMAKVLPCLCLVTTKLQLDRKVIY